jgi:hypothetical protein
MDISQVCALLAKPARNTHANARTREWGSPRLTELIFLFAGSRLRVRSFFGWLRQPTPARRPFMRVDSPVRAFA